MNIFIEAYHTFCEWYMFNTLPEHNFYRIDNNATPWTMRVPPSNLKLFGNIADIPWKDIDLAYVVSPEKYSMVIDMSIPTIFHIDQMPPDDETVKRWRSVVGKNTVTLYWSEEEARAWNIGIHKIHRHPIETSFWKGYNRSVPHAITVATRPVSSWGAKVKGYDILKEAYKRVPIQVVAASDPEFPLSSPMIESEEHMRDTLANHCVYFNCQWKLDRTALEAMAVGLPVVAIRTPQNVYKDIFTNGEDIIYCNSVDEMVRETRFLIENEYHARLIGQNARSIISRLFRPLLAKTQWNDAFACALEVCK